MTGLIQRLNKLAKLTPDQIAKSLQVNGWVCGTDMTAEKLQEMTEKGRVHILRLTGSGKWYDHGAYGWAWDLSYINTYLDKHWLKPERDYGGTLDRPHPAP